MKSKALISCLVALLSMSFDSLGQEFWTGTKNITSAISRTGIVGFGYTQIRNNSDGNATVFEHTSSTGNIYIRSIIGREGETGHVVLNDLGGNVGIGTNTPQAKLAVNGNILAKEVKVKTDITVPDYVFEPDYELPTLADVEAYVTEHKHLPEIPSARDIENDGLNLAEMNLLLLKKVEELTLYLIEERKARKLLVKRMQLIEDKVNDQTNKE
ncbi:hypothetical protein JHJ32_21140 [Parapedobacter sp. ISTM3]|uniref:hypothetical protein n=1 Tax=Parapedobacter sp. ISTM3 TaxID=2800130 RepID=UPI001904F04B|nr:hypothetical protein [Parapedobacter sp. ISTM3]MBK1442518.1 hypothetical protein [Parapedobacter sp. ISTM3]